MYFGKNTSGGRVDLQIVESRGEGDAVLQQVILPHSAASRAFARVGSWSAAALGRALCRQGRRRQRGDSEFDAVHWTGSAFERSEETGCREVIGSLARARHHDFGLERMVFLTAPHRLFSGDSDRAADRWPEHTDARIAGSTASSAAILAALEPQP
jgi:hypothetical protein